MPPTLDLSRISHSKMVISTPRINLRRAASYNHNLDRGPISSTSSRFSFNHLVFSPPPSPGLPSLSPPPRRPPRGLVGLNLPDFPTPIVVTENRGRARWTVSIPQSAGFPLSITQYTDLCAKCREVSEQVRSLQPHNLAFGTDSGNYDFIDVQEAQKAGYLPGLPIKSSKAANLGENGYLASKTSGEPVQGPVCDKSLTFVLESADAGLGKTLMMLWTAYGLAEKEGRAFFVDDTRWAYGKYDDIFRPAPVPECSAPSIHEMLPCPRQARHLIVSAATADELFGKLESEPSMPLESFDLASRKSEYKLARQGYAALFKLNQEDGDYVEHRVRELMAKRIVPKSRGTQNGLAVGVHVRRGDRHPLEFQYRDSYIPLNVYTEVARDMIEDKFNHTGPFGGEDTAAKQHSFLVVASDDPMVHESAEFYGSSPAQERIRLASKQSIEKAKAGSPDRHFMHKYVDDTFGWEGGFFAPMFWNLGLPTLSASDTKSSGSATPPETIRLRSLVGRAYMLDLAVLADVSDAVICTASAVGCRLLAVMMGWDSAMDKGNWVNIDGAYGWKGVTR
ncbi:hypothetical protein B0H67DRAFT_549212 [Lasiosphaeris hirsuta]|uniref:Uncharacterized protein n=1 Tax=Lasiosphaeris hirsuta TaxID=260670 RepID=A0AA40BBW7_9PEZI|nr:hypothetical protein B0H67DRAFT_549212 [Lasiosphaeris hirsuta]